MKNEGLGEMAKQMKESRKRMQSGDPVKLFLQSEHSIADHMPTLSKSGIIQFKVQGLTGVTDTSRENVHFSNGAVLSVEEFKAVCRGFIDRANQADMETPVFRDWLRVYYSGDWFSLENKHGWRVSCSRYGDARRATLCSPLGLCRSEWTFSDHTAFENEDLEVQELTRQAQEKLETLKGEAND